MLTAALDSVRITEVWAALGGGPLRLGRGRAFWRNGDGLSVHLDTRKNLWRDYAHKAHKEHGGGVLGLIQVALGCDRRAAVRWIAETFCLDIDGERKLTAAERRQYAQARAEAERFVSWRSDRLEELRELRNFHLQNYHRTLRLILAHGLDHPGADGWADACEQHEQRYQSLDVEVDHFTEASVERQIIAFREQRQSFAVPQGRTA